MRIKTAIIGGGVIGLATAKSILESRMSKGSSTDPTVVLFERESDLGSHSSSRNSEVIHAGFYYSKGSHKARLCVRGKELLYPYLEKNRVPYKRCGKMVVATKAEDTPKIEGLFQKGQENGVEGLSLMSASEVSRIEPWLRGEGGALLSSDTGIVDSHQLMRALKRDILSLGGEIVTQHEVLHVEKLSSGGFELRISAQSGSHVFSVDCDEIINAAGLWAPHWWGRVGERSTTQLTTRYALGRYWGLQAPSPTRRLIYPLPVSGGLGIHLTVDLCGRARFGPDVLWHTANSPEELGSQPNYLVDESSRELFIKAILDYWPSLPKEKLSPDYAGMRVKVSHTDLTENDFQLLGPEQHQVEGLVHLLGIESPGLTSCLAIGEWVAQALENQ